MRGPNSTKIATFRKPKNFALRGLKNYQFLLLPHSQERANLSDFSGFAPRITPAKLKIGTLRPYYVKKFCTKFQQNPTRLRPLSKKIIQRFGSSFFSNFCEKKIITYSASPHRGRHSLENLDSRNVDFAEIWSKEILHVFHARTSKTTL